MNNKGRFRPGTRFVGDVNNKAMTVVKIQIKDGHLRSGGKLSWHRDFVAVIRDDKTGRLFTYGLGALEHCAVTIIGR